MPTLNWIGKEKVVNHHQDVPYRILEHKYGFSAEKGTQENPTNSGNKIIHGDNLEALKSLLPEYEGKIKCIYIDPPYNTGNENWVYNDNVNHPKIKKWLNQVVGKQGEDLTRHDKWLCMMYPRLVLLHKLLSDDGAIFISIDDNEQASLKLMMDEIFGGGNFLANIIWQKAFSPVNLRKTFSSNHDFIITFCKNISNFSMNGLPRQETDLKRYKNLDNDIRGVWTSGDLSVGPQIQEKVYEIITPSGRKVLPPKGYCWRLTKERFEEYLSEKRIWFGEKGDNVPRIKRFLSEVKEDITPMTIWLHSDVGHNQSAKQDLKKIFSEKQFPFDTPKPTQLIERILQISTDKNSIILDSFAGSGTTAHAVINLNNQDDGNRKFILIEMEEYAETITAERVKRVISSELKVMSEAEKTNNSQLITQNYSFDFYELGLPIFKDDKNLNEEVGEQKIREYIYFTETRKSIKNDDLGIKNYGKYYMGTENDTSYYFYYEKNEITVLNSETLSIVTVRAGQYLIYADICLLDSEYMLRNHIIFKKIPRDIKKF